MNDSIKMVLDANILVRGTLGHRVSDLIERYAETIAFHSPQVCVADARRHILRLSELRNLDSVPMLLTLERLAKGVRFVEPLDYLPHETAARIRIMRRDVTDWPIVATCLLLKAPLWTEDRDFFGCGIATWTTNNVGIYLRGD